MSKGQKNIYCAYYFCFVKNTIIAGLPTLDESLEWEMRGAVRCQPIKSRKSKKSWWGGGGGGGGGSDTFFFRPQNFCLDFAGT